MDYQTKNSQLVIIIIPKLCKLAAMLQAGSSGESWPPINSGAGGRLSFSQRSALHKDHHITPQSATPHYTTISQTTLHHTQPYHNTSSLYYNNHSNTHSHTTSHYTTPPPPPPHPFTPPWTPRPTRPSKVWYV